MDLIAPASQDHPDLPLRPELSQGLAQRSQLPHWGFRLHRASSTVAASNNEKWQQCRRSSKREKEHRCPGGGGRGILREAARTREPARVSAGISNHTTSQLVCACVLRWKGWKCIHVTQPHPNCSALLLRHTLGATPPDPISFGMVDGMQRHGVRGARRSLWHLKGKQTYQVCRGW